MTEKYNLSKRRYVIVHDSQRRFSSRSMDGDSIYEYFQHFLYAPRHNKDSCAPEGYFDACYGTGSATIRWLYTEENGYFAPEVSFNADRGRYVWKLLDKLHAAFDSMPNYGDELNPENLLIKLKATVVEYVPESYSTYRPLRVPGESPLISLARAAD